MKRIFAFGSFGFVLVLSGLEARDLTYKIGAGFKQVYTNGFAIDGSNTGPAQQVTTVTGSYGIARDMTVEGVFGFIKNLDGFLTGGAFRYDVQRLISRNFAAWNYINIFVQGGGYVKFGDDVRTTLLLHLPYFGFEIFPFDANDFAVQASGGVAIDLIKDNMIGFTGGALGVDLGLKYYF